MDITSDVVQLEGGREDTWSAGDREQSWWDESGVEDVRAEEVDPAVCTTSINMLTGAEGEMAVTWGDGEDSVGLSPLFSGASSPIDLTAEPSNDVPKKYTYLELQEVCSVLLYFVVVVFVVVVVVLGVHGDALGWGYR